MSEQYEQLRAQALNGSGRGLGLTLFLREGMPAWLAARAAGDLSCATAHEPVASALTPEQPLTRRRKLAVLLAGMAIGLYHERDAR